MYSFDKIQNNIRARQCFDLETGHDGIRGRLELRGVCYTFIFSWGMGWEHLSVSTQGRCPTWDEMCRFKDIFWSPEETCVQYHPRQSNYINTHKHCLHIWRPIKEPLPEPDSFFVGV